jgi:hypothetical protein
MSTVATPPEEATTSLPISRQRGYDVGVARPLISLEIGAVQTISLNGSGVVFINQKFSRLKNHGCGAPLRDAGEEDADGEDTNWKDMFCLS